MHYERQKWGKVQTAIYGAFTCFYLVVIIFLKEEQHKLSLNFSPSNQSSNGQQAPCLFVFNIRIGNLIEYRFLDITVFMTPNLLVKQEYLKPWGFLGLLGFNYASYFINEHKTLATRSQNLKP